MSIQKRAESASGDVDQAKNRLRQLEEEHSSIQLLRTWIVRHPCSAAAIALGAGVAVGTMRNPLRIAKFISRLM